MTQIFRNVNQVIVASVNFKVMISAEPLGTLGSGFSLIRGIPLSKNHDMNHLRFTYLTINVYSISTFKVLGTRLSNNHKLSKFDK